MIANSERVGNRYSSVYSCTLHGSSGTIQTPPMETASKRPVYLNLLKIRLPIGGVVSIVHRITGVLLVLLVPAGAYLLQESLESAAAFERVRSLLGSGLGRWALLVIVWMSAQHLFSGVRHLLLDIHVGVERRSARRSAWLVLAASALVFVIAAVWIL